MLTKNAQKLSEAESLKREGNSLKNDDITDARVPASQGKDVSIDSLDSR